MFAKIYKAIQTWENQFYASFGDSIATPKDRRQAVLHAHIVDHAWIRKLWTNMYPLGAHAWRSNQPDPKRFEKLTRMGIRSIINLRGKSRYASYLFEREACEKHGISLYDHALEARKLGSAEDYIGLLDLFQRAERPVLMHCKSGADRAGLAAALYLLDQEGVPIEQAQKQLSLKYAHQKRSRTGILDHLLAQYAADIADHPMPVREWLQTRYDPQVVTKRFENARKRAA